MGMDVDYVAGEQAIEKLVRLFGDQKHGERSDFADDIIDFVEKMKAKYTKEDTTKIKKFKEHNSFNGVTENSNIPNDVKKMKGKIIEILGGNHKTPIEFTSVNNYNEAYGLYTYKEGVYVFKEGMDLDFDQLTPKEQKKILDIVLSNNWKPNESLC